MPDGSEVDGLETEPPIEGAIWRGYFSAADRAMRLFALGQYGIRRIAEILNNEGYRFRDVKNKPTLFDREGIRAIVANWPEYGGAVLGKKATARNARKITPDTVILNPDRALMDVELCRRVGQVRAERFREPVQSKPDTGARADASIFPLSRITHCSHCSKMAEEKNDPALRGYLIGYEGSRSPRYRHAERVHKCDSRNRSVKADILEGEFARLVAALSVRSDMIPAMVEQLSQFNQQNLTDERKAEMLSEIGLCKQRIQNAEKLFLMARIDEATFRHHINDNEGQILRLQAEMSEEGQVRQMIEVTANMLADMGTRWPSASNEDKQAFAQTLFSEIVFDLETHQITYFMLKPWAAQFLQIRAAQNGAVMWLKGYKPTRVPCYAGRFEPLYRGRFGAHLCVHSAESSQSRQNIA